MSTNEPLNKQFLSLSLSNIFFSLPYFSLYLFVDGLWAMEEYGMVWEGTWRMEVWEVCC